MFFAATGTYVFLDSSIPIAIFLGMHLLFNDPSTSPRTELGRIMFGVLYGLGVMILFSLLEQSGTPTHYDKLLAVPILNLMIKGIDTLARSRVLRRFDPAAIGAALTPRRRKLAYIAMWTVVFAIMQVRTGSQVALARAGALFQNGRAEAAIAHYRDLVRNKPEYAAGHHNLGYALLSVGRPADAATPLRRAVELEPDDAEAQNNLGLALLSVGRPAEAVAPLRRVVEIEPDNAEAQNNLALALDQAGRLREAVDEVR